MNMKTKSLIGIGASIAANCQECVKYHLNNARENGASEEEIKIAVEIGQMAIKGANSQMDQLLQKVVGGKIPPISSSCCAPS